MKLATWNCTAAGIAILLMAGTLRAQSPRFQSARAGSGQSWRQTGPSAPQTNHWAGYNEEAGQPETIGPGSVFSEGGEYIDESMMSEEGPAYPWSSGTWWKNGCWYAASDFVVWHRTRPFGHVIGFDDSFNLEPPPTPVTPVFPPPEFNKNQTGMGVEAGNRTTIGYLLMRDIDNRDHSVEATYLGFNEWDGQAGIISLNPRELFTQLDFSAPGYNAADFYDIFYQSQFHSVELNYRIRNRPQRDRMIMGPDGFWSRQIVPGRTQSYIVGLRGITIDEQWQWLSGRNGISPQVFSGDMLINSDNNLLGVQMGGDVTDVHEGWYWGVRGAAGVYCNFAEGRYRLRAIDNNSLENRFVDSQAHNQSCAFMGEISFMFGVELTDRISLRTSYDLALVGGLVEASDQVSFDKYLAARVPSLNEGGQIFYNGLSVGLEAYW